MEEQNTSGPKDRLAFIDERLDEYEVKIGLPKYQQDFGQHAVIKEYMEYDRDTLERLTPEQCVEGAIILKAFAGHIQRSKNRETARITWADGQLRKLVTPKLNNYRSCGSWQQVFDLACLDDDFTSKIVDIKTYAQERSDRLDFISNTIKDKAEDLKELGRAKRARQYGN